MDGIVCVVAASQTVMFAFNIYEIRHRYTKYMLYSRTYKEVLDRLFRNQIST
jgi:hypothetical protein